MHVKNESGGSIDLGNVENGKIHVFAPNSEVQIVLKSLHESSFIAAKSLKIIITDDFFQANILKMDSETEKIVS